MFSRRRENTEWTTAPQKNNRPKILLCSESRSKEFFRVSPPQPWNAAVELVLVNCEEEQQRPPPPPPPPVAGTLFIRSDKVAVALD